MLKGFVSGEEKDIVRIPMVGKNLFDGDVLGGVYRSNAFNLDTSGGSIYKSLKVYLEQGAYTVSFEHNVNIVREIKDRVYSENIAQNINEYTFTLLASGYYGISFRLTPSAQTPWDNSNIMLNTGSQALPYEPYGYQEGWEVRDNQDRILWGREDELQTATGTLPFKGYSLPLKVKSLLGNAVQNGAPSPDNIVTPEMCGVRTANLYDKSSTTVYNAYFSSSDQWLASDDSRSIVIPVLGGTQYTLSVPEALNLFRINESDTFPVIGEIYSRIVRATSVIDRYTFTTKSSTNYIIFQGGSTSLDTWFNGLMLNTGSTVPDYEPYGWKVPFENHGENLWNYTIEQGGWAASSGTIPTKYTSDDPKFIIRCRVADIIPIPSRTMSLTCPSGIKINFVWVDTNGVSMGGSGWQQSGFTVTAPDNAVSLTFILAKVDDSTCSPNDFQNIMLFPSSILPVYLGEVPTVRRVRKVVFDGTENFWEKSILRAGCFAARDLGIGVTEKTIYCTHAIGVITASELASNNTCYIGRDFNLWLDLFDAQTTTEQFKAYLASEYQSGHPVTAWYVLAEPSTGISNEPLCKISTYADELTTIQVHGLSAPLYGIGDYKDTLNLSTGVVTRKVKRLVLDGTEDWAATGSSTHSWRVVVPSIVKPSTNAIVASIKSSHYKAITFNESYSGFPTGVGVPASSNWIDVCDRSISSLADFKQFLATKYANGTPVCIWYVLETPTTETVTVPTGMTGEIEGYLTQISTPTPTNRSVPKWNGVEETGGTYAVTVYTPPEIPTTTGQNTLTVETSLAPSKLEVSIHAKKIHYGFKIDKSNDDSETAVIYTHDSVTMTPAHMDFTNDRFDYGSWENAFFVRDCYPVALNLDGTIAYRLDPDDYTKKMDGTPSDIFYELLTTAPSDWSTQWKQYYTKSGDEYVLNDQNTAPTFATDTYYKLTYNSSFTGNFMMAFPKVWFYRHEDSQYNYIEISNYKLSDDWKCYAHINASGQEVDFIYLPLFKGVIKDSKLRSLPGQIPQGNTTATDEVNAATALGARWQIWDHSSDELINDLLTLMSKSIDSQGRYGVGRSNAYNASDTVTYGKLQSGTLIKKGKFHGDNSGYKDVKVFGIESLWANRYDRIQGLLLANGVWKVKMTPPYNFTGTDFVTLSNASVPTDVGYLSRVQTSEYGSIPAATISTSGKYFKDFFYRYSNDTCVPLRGGNCGDTDIAGYRFIYAGDPASRTVWSFGASPVYK